MMRIFRISSTLCAILLITCSTALARPVPPLEGLEALRKVLAGITDFSADMTQEKKLSVMKRTLKMSGTVRFRKPDQFYMALNPPHATRMVLNDAVIEQANDRQEGHTRVVLPPEQGLKQWFSKLSVPVTSLPADFDISADLTNSLYTLKIAPVSYTHLTLPTIYSV